MSEPTAQVSDELLAQISEVSNATVLSALRQRGYHKVFMDGVKPLATGRRLCARGTESSAGRNRERRDGCERQKVSSVNVRNDRRPYRIPTDISES